MKGPAWADELRSFKTIKPRRSLADEAADALREFILLGKLPPGEPVPERDLSEALGISRTPLKEALRLLESEGLVVYSPTRRPSVADPSFDEIAASLQVLGALEALAGSLACRHATDDEISEIGELERLMREAPAETDPLEFFKWDMAFHQAIVKAARNQPLAETHKSYNSRLWRARFISSKMRPARDRTLSQHEDILGALVSRDEAACAQHMRRHLEVAVENIATAQAKLQQMES